MRVEYYPRPLRPPLPLIGDFRPISRRISETVRDTTKVLVLVLVYFVQKKSTQNNQHKLAVEHDEQGTECTDSGHQLIGARQNTNIKTQIHKVTINHIRAFDWYQNQRPWLTVKWPWTAIMRSVALHACVSEPTTKICMKIDPYYQRQKCSPRILVSSNISFMQIFAGVR